MIILLQRVKRASVTINDRIYAEINRGLLVYVGFQNGDELINCLKLAEKTLQYRVFADAQGKLNLNLFENMSLELLSVSQFTLAAKTKKGLRPSFSDCLAYDQADQLYQKVNAYWESHLTTRFKSGQFGADMEVDSTNDGPINFLLES